MTILVGDVRQSLAQIDPDTIQCIATSPPYFGLRLYGDDGAEIGKERDLDAYVSSIVEVMRICREKLRDDGTAWVNLGDSYSIGRSTGKRGASSGRHGETFAPIQRDFDVPAGNALLVPFRVATALQANGWTLRAMLPWVKVAAMPESVQSRPCIAHEYVLFLTKRPSGYFYDADAVRVPHVRLWGANNGGNLASGAAQPATINACLTDAQKRNERRATSPLPHPAGRSLRSSDFWRTGAREAAALLAAADGEAVGMLTNDDAPAALVVNPKGSGIPHFAMWPVRLVAPMVLAGTPEAGCCSVCGAPWRRVVERTSDQKQKTWSGAARANGCMVGGGHEGRTGTWSANARTLGFRPSCDHDAPARPAVVLDPFAGAGTTLAVAECLGRDWIGCELYQKNADLYPQRLEVVRKEMAKYMAERGASPERAAEPVGPLFATAGQ